MRALPIGDEVLLSRGATLRRLLWRAGSGRAVAAHAVQNGTWAGELRSALASGQRKNRYPGKLALYNQMEWGEKRPADIGWLLAKERHRKPIRDGNWNPAPRRLAQKVSTSGNARGQGRPNATGANKGCKACPRYRIFRALGKTDEG